MPTYERSSWIEAPLEKVWDFHASTDGLEALTPNWMHLTIESVTGPDGNPDPTVLETGSVIRASIRPFGVGPRQSWTSEIIAREYENGAAYFRDVMHEGPFAHWDHQHRFFAAGDRTRISDVIEFELPGGPLGSVAGPVGKIGMEAMFRYRHSRLGQLRG